MPSKTLTIDAEFKSLIPPLTTEERSELEGSLKAEGCRDALVVWSGQGVLLDGHNRYELCKQHGIAFQVVERPFETRADAKIWIIRNQFGRRNLTPYVRSALVIKLKDAYAEKAKENQGKRTDIDQNSDRSSKRAYKQMADDADVSHDTIHRVEVVETTAPEPIKAAARAGEISTNRAYELTQALKELPEADRSRAAELCGDDKRKLAILTRLHKSAGKPGGNGTYDEIIRTGGFHHGDDLEKWCDFKASEGEAIEKSLKELARYHVRINREVALAEQDPITIEPTDHIICGDCTQVSWPKGINLIIADPPYGLSRGNQAGVRDGKGDWDDLVYGELHTFNERWLRLAVDALADDGSLFVFGTLHNIFSVGHVLKMMGCYIVRDIVWNKPFVQRAVNMSALVPSHEIILWARKGDHHKCYLNEITRDVWDIQPAAPHKHPTEKPEALISRLISMASDPGDLVADPFLGSGTTSAVAAQLKRRYWGVEKDEYWHRIATQRTGEAGIYSAGEKVAA